MNRIVAICLVHNEDVFLDRVIRNIVDFCDQVQIADHQSTDRTADVAKEWVGNNAKVTYRRIRLPSESHEMVRLYANTPTWIFPVDGDEIYDPAGLQRLRLGICRGQYDQFRQAYGHVLHCTTLDHEKCLASGYLAPPSRSTTKFYNFNAIYDWEGPCMEKCLGGSIFFKPGYTESSNWNHLDEVDWDSSLFRCLHTVFLKRSSRQKGTPEARLNVSDILAMGWKGQLMYHFRRFFGDGGSSLYKHDMYRRGALVQKDVKCFFPSIQGTVLPC